MKNIKNYITESIFDVDKNIDDLDIPAKPKVSKKDYPSYEQAWHDTLISLLDTSQKSQDFLVFFKVYKEWLSDWSCGVDMETYYEEHEFDEYIDWDDDVYEFVDKNYNRRLFEEFLDGLIDECEKGASTYRLSPMGSGSFRYALYDTDDLFVQALDDRTFSFGKFASSYKKFKKDIDKILKFYIG